MDTLLNKLQQDFTDIRFKPGDIFSWSPKDRIITYKHKVHTEADTWALLHELGHAILGHTDFTSDFDLVKMEAAAWQQAHILATKYGYKISDEHIQDCLDTYRDWLHQRSACPVCGTISLQKDATTYGCYNCDSQWSVSRTRRCRPYRRLQTSSQ